MSGGYTDFLPATREIRNSTIKIKNSTLAILAAPAAIPPKPNIAAIIATTRNITVQRNIIISFKLVIRTVFKKPYQNLVQLQTFGVVNKKIVCCNTKPP
ncbi:MAG: hypothetical protein JWR87_3153 [Segetibacter sp.]|jgi:hypothetical protein|nr:hypothetical protein [Segetibacter sp.]